MLRLKLFAASVLSLMLVCPAFWGGFGVARAQEASSAQAAAAPAAQGEKAAAPVQEEKKEAAEKKEATQEAEGEADPNDAFRHSAAVKAIARMTGLSVDGAFWLCMVLNFAIVVGGLWALLRKSIPAMFRSRVETIQRGIEEARKTGDEARRRLAEVETRLSRLDVEIEQMRREAEAAAAQEEQRVLAAAEEERRRIVESAEQEIACAANAARRRLKIFAVDLGVSLAEQRIRIEEGADQRLVREFASRLGRDGN